MAKVLIKSSLPLRLFLWLRIYANKRSQSPGQAIITIVMESLGKRGYELQRAPTKEEWIESCLNQNQQTKKM